MGTNNGNWPYQIKNNKKNPHLNKGKDSFFLFFATTHKGINYITYCMKPEDNDHHNKMFF